MKTSYNQLQTYFEDKLPTPHKLAEAITFHAFEVESIEKSGDDTILDVKVLPDRFCYAKSIQGIAREIATILNIKPKEGMIKIEYSSKKIPLKVTQINEVLGTDISKAEIISILERLNIKAEEGGAGELSLTLPSDRLDLPIWRDIPEEIGRIYGYDKIKPILPKSGAFKPKVEKTFYYCEKIKNILVGLGISEVYTYSFGSKGEYEIEKPLASDKNYLRTNLTDGITQSLELNARNADLLGLDTVQIFEIGKVFAKEGEHTSLAIGVRNVKKKQEMEKEKIKHMRDRLLETLEAQAAILCTIDDTGGLISCGGRTIGVTNNVDGVMEIDLDILIEGLPQPTSYDDLKFGKASAIEYKRFSLYPFIVRDIAVYVPESTKSDTIWSAVAKGINEAGAKELLVRHSMFDEFKKEDKVSYAFRLVFQSMEKTLTDEEINKVMEKVYGQMKENGWEVR